MGDRIENFNPPPKETELKQAPTGPKAGETVKPQELTPEVEGGISLTEKNIREGAATTVRYGGAIGAMFIPGVRGTALRNILMQSFASGGSELVARKLERISTDPEIDTLWSDYKAGLAATGIDFATERVTRGVGRIYKNAFGKLVIPSEMPKDAEIALKVLGRMKPDKTLDETLKLWKAFSKNRPFAPTFGQINAEEKRFINFLESTVRSGWFSRGKMVRFDKRNMKAVEEVFDRYVSQRTKEMSDVEFGTFMQRLVGRPGDNIKDLGEMFIPAEAYGKYLYVKFDDMLEQTGHVLDGTALRQKVRSIKSKRIRQLFNGLAGDGTLPPLVSKKTAGFTETEIAQAWQNLPAADVEAVIRELGSSFKKGDKTFNRFLNQVKDTIQKPFDKFIAETPELKELYDAARMTHGQNQDYLHNKVIDTFRNTLKHRPSGVTHFFNGLKGPPAADYDRLRHLRDALYYQASVPRLSKEQAARLRPSYQGALKRVRPEIARGGKEAIGQAYEKDVLQPLRHKFISNFIDGVTGNLDYNAMLKRVEAIEKEVPELLNEIWGSPGVVKNMKEMLTTMRVLGQKQEGSIFIQLAQAGAVGSVLGGAAGYFTADEPLIGAGAGGALGILMGPSILSRVFVKPELVHQLTTGMHAGVRSVKMAQVLRKVATMKAASETFRGIESEDAAQFYSTFVPEGE